MRRHSYQARRCGDMYRVVQQMPITTGYSNRAKSTADLPMDLFSEAFKNADLPKLPGKRHI